MKQINIQNGKLIIALSRALQVIHHDSEYLFRQNNLTMAQFAVLEALYHKGDMTIGKLIETVLSSSGNMTVVVRNLEKAGFIERLSNQKDKRSYLITLTEAGKILISKVYDKHMTLVEKNLLPLDENDKEMIIKILKKLY